MNGLKRMVVLSVLFLAVFPAFAATPAVAGDLRVLMILWRGETPCESGFEEALEAKGYALHTTIIDAKQDRDALAAALKSKVEPYLKDFDYVYVFGTTACEVAKSIIRDRLPMVFVAVTSPVSARLVKSMKAPGVNISGVTNKVPMDLQIENARKVIPFKRLGVLFNPKEKNSVSLKDEAKRAGTRYGYQVVELPCTPGTDQLEKNLKKVAEKRVRIDAVYLPTASYLASNSAFVVGKLNEARVPTIAAQEDFVKAGALTGTVSDYKELGARAAEILLENRAGKALAAIPVGEPKSVHYLVNKRTAELLGIDLKREKLLGVRVVD